MGNTKDFGQILEDIRFCTISVATQVATFPVDLA